MAIDTSLAAFLNKARIAIDGSLNHSEIQGYLSQYGYALERLQAGKSLYETAFSAHERQKKEFGEQIDATAEFKKVWEEAQKNYMRYVKIARIAFKDKPGIFTELALNGKRKRSFSGWLLQASQFYGNLLGEQQRLEAMGNYGITPELLTAGQVDLEAVQTANISQQKEKGDAQAARETRDEAIDNLDDWLSDFIAIAKIALEEKPQLMESLGILARS